MPFIISSEQRLVQVPFFKSLAPDAGVTDRTAGVGGR
jgi:hypothetical protein